MMRSHRSRSRVRRDEYELGDITQRVNVLSRQNLSFTIVHDLDRDYPEKLRKKEEKKKDSSMCTRKRNKISKHGKKSDWGFSEIPCHGRDKKQK